MALQLNQLTQFDDIVIQCHDNPDADALASGFALKLYLDKMGKEARFIYGGVNPVSKSNLVLMMENLGIPAEHVTDLEKPQLLITVDCQYGESNVTHFEAENIAVIDHHQISGELPSMSEVRSSYGSCSTVMYELFLLEGLDINEDEKLATALYYGLMTDTGGFAEISHPADKDLRDLSKPNKADIVLFKNSNISREELIIAGDALKHAYYNDDRLYAMVEAKPCDPNILGLISDMLLEVDCAETCLVYSILPFGVKISVRSCVKEVKASELAGFLASGYGGGGGHLVKAGGLLKKELLEQGNIGYNSECIGRFLDERMHSYFDSSVIIHAGEQIEDLSEYDHYIKHELTVGYVKGMDLAPSGTMIMIRTLEGDVDVTIDEYLIIIIGVDGEIYPTNKKKFEAGYRYSDAEYIYPGDYSPKVTNTSTGDRISLLAYAGSCIAKGGSGIYAKKLDHRVKVFTRWDPDKYYLGVEGDYLAVRADDPSDIYVIAKDIFHKTYSKADIQE